MAWTVILLATLAFIAEMNFVGAALLLLGIAGLFHDSL